MFSMFLQTQQIALLNFSNSIDLGLDIEEKGIFYNFRGGSRPAATSKMKRFVINVNGWKPLTIITKCFILDVAAVLDPPLNLPFDYLLVCLHAGHDVSVIDIFLCHVLVSMYIHYLMLLCIDIFAFNSILLKYYYRACT